MHTKNERCKGVISLDSVRNLRSVCRFGNPTWAISCFPFFKFFFLNPLKDSICRITGGINSQILGPKYDADSLPWDDKLRYIT